jgi:hypothetical protein
MCKHFNSQTTVVLASILCFVFGSIVQAALPDPISMWRFEEGSGETAVDAGIGGHHGTLVGDVSFVQDEERGSVLEFGTSESYIDTHAGITELGNADFSMAAWIHTFQDGAAIVGKTNDDREWSFHEKQFYLSAGTEQGAPVAGGAHFYGNQAGEIWGATPVNGGGWQHVCVTWDNDTDEQHIYVNGELDDLSPVWVYYGGRGDNVGDVVRIGYDGSGNSTADFSGRMDDVAIFDVTLTPEQVLELMHLPLPENASSPLPYDRATDLLPQEIVLSWTPGPSANTHNVYFGMSFADVNDASVSNPLGVLASETQSDTSYAPGLLEYGQTYYWRVDEVKGAPDFAVIKGAVWSFATEAVGLPIATVMATASSSDRSHDPSRTIDGSGLNEMNQHGTLADDMWLSAPGSPAWIQYEFDKAYKLHEMRVWNANQALEFLFAFGVKDVVVETSVDGVDWTVVEGATQFAQGTGSPTYEHNTTIDLAGLLAKYVRININSGWGFAGIYSLSEIKFLTIPTSARYPQATVEESMEVVLDWRAGREAVQHELYLGTDPDNLPLVDTLEENQYSAGVLTYGSTYFWRVDEVNQAASPTRYEGDLWSFVIPDFAVVDGFESYDDNCNRVFFVWQDGWGHNGEEDCGVAPFNGNGTGSLVGNANAPFAERSIVYSGNQSMPLGYDGFGSETDKHSVVPANWAQGGAETLVLFFSGLPENASGQIYVKVNGAKVVHSSTSAIQSPDWQQWNIDLASIGTDLSNITSLSLGVDSSGPGTVYVDDIRLYRVAP